MKTETFKQYGPLGIVDEVEAVYCFARIEDGAFPHRSRYTGLRVKKINKVKNENRDLYYLPVTSLDSRAKLCLKQLRELNYNLDYGLARDAMQHLKAHGLFIV